MHGCGNPEMHYNKPAVAVVSWELVQWDVGVEAGPVRRVHVQQGQLLRGANCCCGVGLLDLLQQVVGEAAAPPLQQLPLLLLKHKLLCPLLLLLFVGLLLLVQAMQPC
jgi:hypothetical protein